MASHLVAPSHCFQGIVHVNMMACNHAVDYRVSHKLTVAEPVDPAGFLNWQGPATHFAKASEMLAHTYTAASHRGRVCTISSRNMGSSRCVQCRFQTQQDRAVLSTQQPTTTVGQPLTKEEAASLAMVCQLSSTSGGQQQLTLKGPVNILPAILAAGAAKQHSNHQELEGAMLAAEQAYLGTLGSHPGDASAPDTSTLQRTAMWQPMFASSGGFPRLLYIPVPEYFDLSRAQKDGTIDIITELGPVTTHFLGTCSWSSPHDLEYAISKVLIELGSWKGTLPFKLVNRLCFFYAEDGVACARSKLGGTMLMVADPAGSAKYLQA